MKGGKEAEANVTELCTACKKLFVWTIVFTIEKNKT